MNSLKKLDAKYADIVFKVFLTLIMSFVMGTIITIFNIGITPDFLQRLGAAIVVGFITSFPAVLIAVPIAKKGVKVLIEEEKAQKQAF